MGRTFSFLEITELCCADAFDMTCRVNFKLIQDFMPVFVTMKFEKDWIKNEDFMPYTKNIMTIMALKCR